MLSGIHSLVTVNQHPVIVTSLADDVILHCELTQSPEEKMTKIPVLYWEYLKSDRPGMWPKLWPASAKYNGRVERLDNDFESPNKSVLFRNVQWEDSGAYQCKLSITTEKSGSERKRGNSTMLLVYDSVSLNTTQDGSWLQCAVRVSWDPGFVLSISHIGSNQTLESDSKDCDPALLYVTLSVTIPLMKSGGYECRLHLNSTLITKNTFSHNLPDELKVYPEPWLLYAAMLLVPVTLLLGVTTVLLICRH